MEIIEENIRQVFHQFAEGESKNPFIELNTCCQNETADNQIKQRAFQNHFKIFKLALENKMQSLLKDDKNGVVENELEALKQFYFTELGLFNLNYLTIK